MCIGQIIWADWVPMFVGQNIVELPCLSGFIALNSPFIWSQIGLIPYFGTKLFLVFLGLLVPFPLLSSLTVNDISYFWLSSDLVSHSLSPSYPRYIPIIYPQYVWWLPHFHRWKMHCLRQDEVGIVGTPIAKLVIIGLITRTVDISIVVGVNQ